MTRRHVALGIALAALVAVAVVGAFSVGDAESVEVGDENDAEVARAAATPAPLVECPDPAERVELGVKEPANAPTRASATTNPLAPIRIYGTIRLEKGPGDVDTAPNGSMELVARIDGRDARGRVSIVGGRFTATVQRFGLLDFDSIVLDGEDADVPREVKRRLAPSDGLIALTARVIPRILLHVRDAATGSELERVIIDGEPRGRSPLRAPRNSDFDRQTVGFFDVTSPGFESQRIGIDLTRAGTRFVALSPEAAQSGGDEPGGDDLAKSLLDRAAAMAEVGNPEGPTVSGTVTIPPGRQIRGFVVRAEVGAVFSVSEFCLIGGPGTYRWSLRAPSVGRCRLVVDDHDNGNVAWTTIDVPTAGVARVPIVVPQLATTRIRLIDAQNGSNATDGDIALALAPVDGGSSAPFRMTRDDADRSCFSCSLSAGEYRVVATRGDVAPVDDRVTLVPGPSDLVVRVAHGTAIVVNVVAPNARIPASEFAHVTVTSLERGAATIDAIDERADFAVRATPLVAGRWRVTLPRVSGYADVAPRDVDVVAGRTTPIEFTLTPSP